MTYKNRNRLVGKVAGTALVAFTLLSGLAFPQDRAAATPLADAKSGTTPGQAQQPYSPNADSITLVSPSTVTIAESDDYATQVLGDPWDMNNIEDVNFPHNFTLPSVGNGIWSVTTTGSPQDPEMSMFLQYQNIAGVYNYMGEKTGANYPISTNRFTHLRFRMYAESAGPDAHTMVWWFLNGGDPAPCSNCNLAGFIPIEPGWHIYDVNLNADPARWAGKGSVAGLRLDAPWNAYNNNIKLDWARLTPDTSAPVNIQWRTSGTSSTVNLFLSLSPDAQTGNEYQIASVAAGAGQYNWTGTGMAPGVYYVHAQYGTAWTSSGPITVNAAPVLQIDAPGPLSGEDFAQAQLGQTWDGSNSNQFALVENCQPVIYTGDYLQSTSRTLAGGVADPSLSWLWPYRGVNPNTVVDTSRYRYMNVKLWLQAPDVRPNSPLNAGPRMTFAPDNRHIPQQTQALLARYDRWMPIVWDMAAVPKVPNPSPADNYGWSGDMRTLRIDPHEEDDFGTPTSDLPFFRIGGAHLTTQPMSGPSTLIRWHKYQGTGTVSLFYDTDNSGFNGQPIPGAANLPLDQGYVGWNTANLPNATSYYVYAVATDGYNTSKYYSLLSLKINHASPSTVFADVPTNNPFVNDINNLAVRGIIGGYPQFDSSLMFKPGFTATRAQLSKMVVLGAGGGLVNPGSPTFADVPTSSSLYTYVETAVSRGIVSGYACGGAGEPCTGANQPYFRPNRNVTRAQTSKMISISQRWGTVAPANPSFADIDAGSPLYGYVEAAVQHNIIGGYPCGGVGEPCTAGNKPYFRPSNDVTRGQISKMLSGAVGPFTGALNTSGK